MWSDAQLKWELFLPIADIDSFVKENKLEYTLNARWNSRPSTSGKPKEEIGDVLRRLLNESNTNDNTGIMDTISHYLQDTTGSPTGEPGNQFIRTLTTEVAESTIIGIERADQPNSRTLDQETMQRRAVILKKYLDAKVDRETQALFALQALVHRLEHPNKLLSNLFQCLYDGDVISQEGFENWEKFGDPLGNLEQQGRGVAIAGTRQFFTWMREPESDEDKNT
jgi:translation initiation factor 4G